MHPTLAVAHHKLLDDALVGLFGDVGIFLVQQPQTHRLEIGSGEDGRARRLEVVADGLVGIAIGGVVGCGLEASVVCHQLIPAAGLRILTGCQSLCQRLQLTEQYLVGDGVCVTLLLHLFQDVHQRQEVPSDGTSPVFGAVVHLGTLDGADACPVLGGLSARLRGEGVVEQLRVLVPQELPRNVELMGYQVPVVVTDGLVVLVFVDHLCQQGRSHVLSVAPHLVHVVRLVPPASGSRRQRGVLDGVGTVGRADSLQGCCHALVGRQQRRGIAVRLAVGKTSAGRQLTQFEVQLDGVQVVEALAQLAGLGNVEAASVVLHGVEPRLDVDLLAVLVVVHSLEDGLRHQSRHVVEHLLRVPGLLRLAPPIVKDAEARLLGIGVEVVDTRVDDQLRIAHTLLELAGRTGLPGHLGLLLAPCRHSRSKSQQHCCQQ